MLLMKAEQKRHFLVDVWIRGHGCIVYILFLLLDSDILKKLALSAEGHCLSVSLSLRHVSRLCPTVPGLQSSRALMTPQYFLLLVYK